MQRISVDQRRARLARRHRLTNPADTVEDVTRSLVCLHGTDPASVYLSAWARIAGFEVAQLDHALYDDRSLIKHLAMRRTLFVVGRDDLGDVQSGASDRVAGSEARKMIRMIAKDGIAGDGVAWLERAKSLVVAALGGGRQATSAELRDEIEMLQGTVTYGSGRWGADLPIAPRILTILSAEGRVVRATNRGDWAASRPRWALMESWLGQPLLASEPAVGHRRMVERWLRAFGPGTADDIKWWLGSTVAAVKRSLAELDAIEVGLGDATGYLLADDRDDDPPTEPWVALLPALDPTSMGWTDRDWYLGDHKQVVYDSFGNAGPTIWSDGRIVGGWWQDAAGAVVTRLLEDIGAEAAAAVEIQAARLTEWLAGRVIMPRFPSPLAKEVASGSLS